MKKKDVSIGRTYVAKVSGGLTTVRLTGESPYGGWDAVNTKTGRAVRIRTAARLRYPAVAKDGAKVTKIENLIEVPSVSEFTAEFAAERRHESRVS